MSTGQRLQERLEFSFEKLQVWQDARTLAKLVYVLTRTFPSSELYGLCSQLQRAAISVCSNIAEGTSRTNGKDQAHFYRIAYGSLMEVMNQLILSNDFGFVTDHELMACRQEVEKVATKLNKLRNAALNRKP